ncbi:hypothetical protein G9A89_020447 [Geosiphon pyriformis]|nr:hypothetical protein G9A89_020447 [Geosiphon pyriformis]
MSKKKAPKGAFHGPTGGFFLQKKRVVLGNVKHSSDKKNISLNRSKLGNSVFSNVDNVSGDEEDTNMTSINIGSLLDSAANISKAKYINTGAIFGSLLGFPNFVMDNDKDIEVSVKKSFALDINLSAIKGNSTMVKTQLIRKFFSLVNGFGGATTPSKFKEIIRFTFTSEKSMNMAASLAREKEIVINTDLKKSEVRSNWAIVIKEIPIDTPKKMIITAVAEFGNIKSIKIQLIGMWQKAVVEFAKSSQADLLAKDSVHVAKAVGDCDIWASRDCFRALLFTLPVETTVHDLGILLDRAGGKTCIINRSLDTDNRFWCAVVGFESEKDLDLTFCTELDLVRCWKCGHFGHSALKCDIPVGSMPLSSLVKSFKGFVSEERHLQLAKLYKKKKVPIFHPVAFGGKSWAQVVSVVSPLSHGFFAGPSSNLLSSSYCDIGNVSSLNECLVSLKHSLELLSDLVSTIVRHLDSAGLVPLVSSSFVSPPDASASLASGSGSNMVLECTLILSTSFSSTVDVGVHVFSSSNSRILTGKVGGLESKLASLEASIGSVLACLDGLCSSLGAPSHFFSK